MHADRNRLTDQRARELGAVVVLTFFAELAARFDRQSTTTSELLDRLDAAIGWTGKHARDLERRERDDESRGLLHAALVQRA